MTFSRLLKQCYFIFSYFLTYLLPHHMVQIKLYNNYGCTQVQAQTRPKSVGLLDQDVENFQMGTRHFPVRLGFGHVGPELIFCKKKTSFIKFKYIYKLDTLKI